MQHLDRVAGIAAAVVSAAILAACAEPWPPASPAVAAVPPAQLSPVYPAPGTYNPPLYGTTIAPAYLPSSAGTTSTTVIMAPYAPPPPLVETPPPAPSTLMAWQPGHWFWNGARYDWLPGHYVERPLGTVNWMPGYWHQAPSGWVWIEGRWT
jgi:hypothetical protein